MNLCEARTLQWSNTRGLINSLDGYENRLSDGVICTADLQTLESAMATLTKIVSNHTFMLLEARSQGQGQIIKERK